MLQRVGEFVRGILEPLASVPVDGVHAFEALKQRHPVGGESHLSTMADARRLVRDALAAIESAPWRNYDLWLPERVQRLREVLDSHEKLHSTDGGWCSCPRRWVPGRDPTAEVGSLRDVSRIFGHEHFIGMEYWDGPDGWRLVRLELLDSSFEALYHNDRLRGFQRGCILRMESGCGICYV